MASTEEILLVNPPFRYFETDVASLNYKRPPLGLLYVASYAEAKLGVDVEILDAYAENLSVDETVSRLRQRHRDIIGFTVTTPTVTAVDKMIATLRAETASRDTLFVVGGPHVTLCPQEPPLPADFFVVGEGEATFVDIVRYRRGELRPENIRGVYFRTGTPAMTRTAPRELVADLDDLPIPDRSKIKAELYGHIFTYAAKGALFTTVFTSRGCSYRCAFCGNEKLWGGQVRRRSIAKVAEELEALLSQGYRLVFFDDDDFLSSRQFAYGLLREIIDRRLEFKWVCHARVAFYDDGLLELMSRAGCVEAQIGVESFNERALQAADKEIRTDRIGECISRFQRHGINVWATLIIGLPEEDLCSLEQSIDRLIEADPFYATFIMLLPFPGTRIFDLYREKGYLITEDWERYTWHGNPVFRTDKLSPRDMIQFRKRAYRRFYFRGRAFARYLRVLYRYGMYRSMLKNLFRFVYFSFPETMGGKDG